MRPENYGKNMFEAETLQEVISRIDKLTAETQRVWGKMTVDKMLAHCAQTVEAALGYIKVKRNILGYTLGPLLKTIYTNDRPLGRNAPTDKKFLVTDAKNFEQEKTKLKKLITELYSGGPEKITKQAHAFFGHLTPAQWARGTYKHLDHHLRQFGV